VPAITLVGMVNKNVTYYLKRNLRRYILQRPLSIGLSLQTLKFIRTIKRANRIRIKNERKHKINIPPICILSVTSKCNLNCIGCYAIKRSKQDELSIADIDKIIGKATSLGIYLFIIVGGEPLMKESILHVLSKYPKAIFLLFTNGLLINIKIVQFFQKNRHVFPVLSYEGNNDFNDSRRGKGKGSLIENSLKILQQSKLIYGFSSLATPANVDYITSATYFRKMEAYGMKFGFIIDYVPEGNKIEELMVLNESELIKKKENLQKRKIDSNLTFFNLPTDEKLFGECGAAGKLLFHINAQGNVEPCVFCNESTDNIKLKPLNEILGSDFFKEVRKNINEIKASNGEHSIKCMQFNNCSYNK
jgi:MoaA/NifB/PqqE/SkfB family radical SAM enzyme